MKKNVTLYICQIVSGWMKDHMQVSDYDASQHDDNVVLLGTQVVEIDIPEVDINQIMIQKLQGQIQVVRAKSEAEVTRIQGRIQEMMAIGQDCPQ